MRIFIFTIIFFSFSCCKNKNNTEYLNNISSKKSTQYKYSSYHFDSIKVNTKKLQDSILITFSKPFLQKEVKNQKVFWVKDSLNLGKQDKRNYSNINNFIIPNNKPIYGAIQNTIWNNELNSNLNRWIYWKYE